jgi:hypothetical protein
MEKKPKKKPNKTAKSTFSHKLPYPALITTRDFHAPIIALRGTHLNFPHYALRSMHVRMQVDVRSTIYNIQMYQAFDINAICTYPEACTSTKYSYSTPLFPQNSNSYLTFARTLQVGKYKLERLMTIFRYGYSMLVSLLGIILESIFLVKGRSLHIPRTKGKTNQMVPINHKVESTL